MFDLKSSPKYQLASPYLNLLCPTAGKTRVLVLNSVPESVGQCRRAVRSLSYYPISYWYHLCCPVGVTMSRAVSLAMPPIQPKLPGVTSLLTERLKHTKALRPWLQVMKTAD